MSNIRQDSGWRARLLCLMTVGAMLWQPAVQARETLRPWRGTIAVSGASGKLGGEVVDLLLQRGVRPQDLILITRTPDKLAARAAQGIRVRQGDFDAPETLPAALAGAQRLLLISSGDMGRKLYQQNLVAITAARQAGIRMVIYTSFVNAQKLGEQGVLPGHYQTEQALKSSGLQWIVLRNQDYMENLLYEAPRAVASGVYSTDFGEGRAASVAHIDCAEAAAAALTQDGVVNRVLEITGPELMSSQDVARTLSEVTGKPVRAVAKEVVPKSDAAPVSAAPPASGAAPVAGPSADAIAFFVGVAKAQREGLMAIRTDDFKMLTGHDPRTFRTVLEAQRAQLLAPPPAPPPAVAPANSGGATGSASAAKPDPLRNYYGNTLICGAPITGEDACHQWMERDGVLKGGSALNGKGSGHYTVSPVYPDGHVQVCLFTDMSRRGPALPAGMEIPKSRMWDANAGTVADCHTKNFETQCVHRDPKSMTEQQIREARERRAAQGICYPYWDKPIGSVWLEKNDPLPTQDGVDKLWLIQGHM